MAETKVITKQLAGSEDIVRGIGTVSQQRSTGIKAITKLNVSELQGAIVVDNIAEMSSLVIDNLGDTKTVVVTEEERGGVFIYRVEGASNGGTIFDSSSTGKWHRQYEGAVSARWFGADTAIDSYSALLSASLLNESIELTDGLTYKLETQLVLNNGSFDRRGIFCNGLATITSDTLTVPTIKIHNGSGELNKYFKLEGIKFGNYGLEIAGACGITPTRCYFGEKQGLTLHNETSGQFTEGIVAKDCRFKCETVLEYKVTGGNDSFHGSGLDNCWIDGVSGNSPIKIGADAFVYNAPMTINVFGTGESTAIFDNSSTRPVTMTGEIKIEDHKGDVVSGSTINFAGALVAVDNPKLGSLKLVDLCKITGPSTGNIFYSLPKSSTFAVKTTTDNQVVSLGKDAVFTVFMGFDNKFVLTTSNNLGAFPDLGTPQVLTGSLPIIQNSGDTLQIVVPTLGTVVQVHVSPLFNPAGTYNGQVLERYEEI